MWRGGVFFPLGFVQCGRSNRESGVAVLYVYLECCVNDTQKSTIFLILSQSPRLVNGLEDLQDAKMKVT